MANMFILAVVLAAWAAPQSAMLPALVPVPATVEPGPGDGFSITPETHIELMAMNPHAERIARELATLIRRATGALPRVGPPSAAGTHPAIRLVIGAGPIAGTIIESEGYDLKIAADAVTLTAPDAAGLFYGVQTLRQILPAAAEYDAILFQKPRTVTLPALHVRDAPRYQWRGAMLDVARHFFAVDDVKRYIDLIALHKMNRLHLHLADDQGWRIEIKKWPDLTLKGFSRPVRAFSVLSVR